MPLPRIRLSTRRLMTAIAILALIIAVEDLLRRRATYLDRALHYGKLEAWYARSADVRSRDVHLSVDVTIQCRAIAGYYGRLSRKYDRAARYPWLSAEPDPPPPQ